MPEPKPRLSDMSDEERAESWLTFNLRIVYRDNDILKVGREEDHWARVAKAKYGEVPDWAKGRPMWRDLREMAELSRQELADRLGVDRASISRYESGARWPDSGGSYVRWLKERYAVYVVEAIDDVNLELLLRDGWMVDDPERGPRSVKWVPGLVSNDGDLEDVLAGLDERVVQPWIDAGMPDSLEGHYRPEDRDQERRSQ